RQQALLQGAAGGAGRTAPTRPEVRFLGPGQNSAIEGDEVTLSMMLLAPSPLRRYRVWINGRPFGEHGFSLPAPGQKNLILDKNIILDKNLILDKGEARTALAGALPSDAGALV